MNAGGAIYGYSWCHTLNTDQAQAAIEPEHIAHSQHHADGISWGAGACAWRLIRGRREHLASGA